MNDLEALTRELMSELRIVLPDDIMQVRAEWMEEMKRAGIPDRVLRFVNTITDYVLSEACKTA